MYTDSRVQGLVDSLCQVNAVPYPLGHKKFKLLKLICQNLSKTKMNMAKLLPLKVYKTHFIWIVVGQGPTALAVGAGGGCLDIFSLIYRFSFLSPSLWETARYRLKYCLKGPLSPKQPTNQPTNEMIIVFQNKSTLSVKTTGSKFFLLLGANSFH